MSANPSDAEVWLHRSFSVSYIRQWYTPIQGSYITKFTWYIWKQTTVHSLKNWLSFKHTL